MRFAEKINTYDKKGLVSIMTVDSIKFNQNVDPKLFDFPELKFVPKENKIQ
jgi:outer membrane lipoprotein-sorting protein